MKNNKLIAEFMWGYSTVLDVSDTKYHESWDWLIPVVKRCLEIYHVQQMNDDLNFKFYDSMGDIKKTYKAVVEFIKENNNGTEQ